MEEEEDRGETENTAWHDNYESNVPHIGYNGVNNTQLKFKIQHTPCNAHARRPTSYQQPYENLCTP